MKVRRSRGQDRTSSDTRGPRRSAAVTVVGSLVGIAWLCGSPRAAAQAPMMMCMDPKVIVESPLDAQWNGEVARVCDRLAALRDVDRSAQIHLLPAGSDVVLEVVLVDGRSALRRVRSVEELELAVEALVVVPPAPALMGPSAEGPEPSAATHATPETQLAHAQRARAPRLGVELGAGFIGRFARTPSYVSAGVDGYAAIRLSRWLLGLTLRWDPFDASIGATPPQFEMDTIGIGSVVARRTRAGKATHVDLGATAALVVESQASVMGGREINDSRTDLRFGLICRLLLGEGPWHWALSLQPDFSPADLRRPMRAAPSLGAVPIWSIGIGAGAVWGGS